MTDCKRLKDHLYDYVDGILPKESRKLLKEHLEQCPECESVLQNLNALKSQLQTLKPLQTSPDFDMILRTRIKMDRSLNRGGLVNWPMKLPIYAASGALVILAAFFILNFGNNIVGGSQSRSTQTAALPAEGVNVDQATYSESVPKKVVFPMEFMSGTPLNSTNFPVQRESLADSSRGRFQDRSIRAVEF